MMTTVQLRQRQLVSQSASQPVSQPGRSHVTAITPPGQPPKAPATAILHNTHPPGIRPGSHPPHPHPRTHSSHSQATHPASPQPPNPPTIRQPRTTSNTHCLAQQPPTVGHPLKISSNRSAAYISMRARIKV